MSVNTPILQQILSELVALRHDVTELKTDVAVLKTDVAVLKTDVAVLKTDVAVLKTDVAVLKTDVAVLKRDVAVLKKDVIELKKDVNVLKKDMTVLKKDVAKLKTDYGQLRYEFNEFRNNTVYYTQSLSRIQEKTDTLHIFESLRQNLPTLNIEIYPFGDFYRQNDIHPIITDIDGCISIDSIPHKPNTTRYTKNNSLQFKQSQYRNEILFLESKTQLDKCMLDKKLKQFDEIYTIVSNIKTYESGSDEFMTMITSSPLNRHPSRIYFMLIAEDMAVSMRRLIYHINTATLTEQLYKELVYSLFKEIPMYTLLKRGIKDNLQLKLRYIHASSFDEYIALFSEPEFNPHRAYLNSFFTPYAHVSTLYAKFKGILGYSFQSLLMFPASFS
jgi:hypothetical protein